MDKKIYIADILSNCINGKSTGHYFAVARNYQEMFGDAVVVAGGPIYKTGFCESQLFTLPYNSGGTGIKGRLKTFINARKVFKEAEGHTLILQQCTTITTFLCIALFYHCKSKLYLIQYSREGFRLKIGQFLYKLAKRKIDGIICPNDIVGESFEGVPYCTVPDYIYTGINKKNVIPFDKRVYDFCIVGRLSPEKGAVEVAKIFANTKYRIVIAGKPQSEHLAKEIGDVCMRAKNIKLHLGYISDEEYYSYLHNSKYAILNYSEEYSNRSSGVVLDTIFNAVPVLGRRCRSLQFIEDYELGQIYDDLQSTDVNVILNKEFHDNALSKIEKYCNNMKKYIEKLSCFVG